MWPLLVPHVTRLAYVRIKKKKKWRESVKYLHSRIDRARFWRREGSVLIADMAALRQEMEREASQRRQKGTVVGYYSCGAAYPSRVQRGGNRNARRKRQRDEPGAPQG